MRSVSLERGTRTFCPLEAMNVLESNGLKSPGGVSERKVRKIHCTVDRGVQDDGIKHHNVVTYLFDYCTVTCM